MKTSAQKQTAFTLIEVLVLTAVLCVIGALIFPALAKARPRSSRIGCVNGLKQVGLAHRMWANEHEEEFVFASSAPGSSQPFAQTPQVFRHYQALSNELVSPKLLRCPNDVARLAATNFTAFFNHNLSYFVGLDAREAEPQSILSGDRNTTGGTVSNGFLRVFTAKSPAGWAGGIHPSAGNIGLADGSVQQVASAALREQIAQTATNRPSIRFAIP